jgi:hypothetical protein
MQCNKQQCIFYNTDFSDHCEKREDLAKECIEQGYKDMRESLEGYDGYKDKV